MQKHPDLFQQVFVKLPDDPIVDASTFGAYFHIHESSWSLPGHHRRTMEEKTLAYWRDFLQDLEGKTIKLIICNHNPLSA